MTRAFALPLFLLASAGAIAATETSPPKSDKSPPTLEVLSGQELVVRPQKSDEKLEFHVPVRCTPPDQFAALSFPPIALFLKGTPLPPTAVQVSGTETGPAKHLVITIDSAKLARPGAYTLKVQPTPADPKVLLPPVLEFTLSRAAAELTYPTPIRLHRVVYLPWVGHIEPDATVFGEKSGKSFARIPQQERECQLYHANGEPAGRLRFKFPAELGARGEGNATVEVIEDVDLGKTSGALTVWSPQSATEDGQTATVEVTTRVWSVWLFVSIVLGIVGGYFGRTRMEARRARRAALISANEELAALDEFLEQSADLDLNPKVTEIRNALAGAGGAPGATPETITAATAAAKSAFAAASAAAETNRAELRQKALVLRTACGSPDTQPPPLAEFLKGVLQELRQAEAKLTSGSRKEAGDTIQALDQRAKDDIPSRTSAWVTGFEAALNRFAGWPETTMPAAVTAVRADIDALRAAEPLAILTVTHRLRTRIRDQLLRVALDTVLQVADDVHNKLIALRLGLRAPLDALDEALRAVAGERAGATAENLAPIAERIHQLAEATRAALTAAAVKVGFRADQLPAGLAEGQFRAALALIETRRAGVLLEPAESAEVAETAPVGPPVPPAPPLAEITPAPPTWELAVEVSQPLVAGRPTLLVPRIKAPVGQDPPSAVTITWDVNGERFERNSADPLTFTPQKAGPLRIVAEAVAAGVHRRDDLTVRVLEPDGAAALSGLRAEQDRSELLQTAIYGALIALAGFSLFRGAFVGTFDEILAALFWGFTADIGLAKFRELNTTLAPRLTPRT